MRTAEDRSTKSHCHDLLAAVVEVATLHQCHAVGHQCHAVGALSLAVTSRDDRRSGRSSRPPIRPGSRTPALQDMAELAHRHRKAVPEEHSDRSRRCTRHLTLQLGLDLPGVVLVDPRNDLDVGKALHQGLEQISNHGLVQCPRYPNGTTVVGPTVASIAGDRSSTSAVTLPLLGGPWPAVEPRHGYR